MGVYYRFIWTFCNSKQLQGASGSRSYVKTDRHDITEIGVRVRIMMLNATFNNISAISYRYLLNVVLNTISQPTCNCYTAYLFFK